MDFPDEHNEFQSLLLGTQRGTVGEMLCTEQLFDRSNLVSEMYKTLLPDCEVVSAQGLCDSFSRVRVNGNMYRCSSNCSVSAKWLNGEHRTGIVQGFLTNDVVIKQGQGKRRKLTFALAEVAWFLSSPENRSTGILSLGSMVFGFFTSVIHSSASNSQSVFNSAIQS